MNFVCLLGITSPGDNQDAPVMYYILRLTKDLNGSTGRSDLNIRICVIRELPEQVKIYRMDPSQLSAAFHLYRKKAEGT